MRVNQVDNNRYRFANMVGQSNRLDIFNEIDDFWGYGVHTLSYDLSNLDQQLPLTVRIHSPGGSVTEGIAISNLLRAYPGGVTTVGVGFVASIASVILLAGDRVKMDDGAYLMIHRPFGVQEGDADVMANTAAVLHSMDNTLLDVYMDSITKRGNPSQLTREMVFEMMKKETWMTAKEAKGYGFIDEITNEKGLELGASAFKAVAQYKHTPDAIINQQKSEMSKLSMFEKLKALLTEEEVTTLTPEELQEMPEEVAETAGAAIEETGLDPIMAAVTLLEEAGYTVTAPEAMEDDKEMAEMEEKEMEAIAKSIASLKSEIKALKAETLKAKATPSGGNVPATPVRKNKKEQAFDSFALMVKSKIMQR